MKYASIVLAALLGTLSQSEVQAITLWKVDIKHHRLMQINVRDDEESESGSDDDMDESGHSDQADSDIDEMPTNEKEVDKKMKEEENLMTRDDEPEADAVDRSGEFFEPAQIGGGLLSALDEKKYDRVPPVWFAAPEPGTGDASDSFMRSMIMNYALEGKNKDGTPNGVFLVTEAIARQAATEVLETHKQLKGAELTTYLDTYFPRTWAHFDVNHAGKIGVESLPQFMRFLASDQQLSMQQ